MQRVLSFFLFLSSFNIVFSQLKTRDIIYYNAGRNSSFVVGRLAYASIAPDTIFRNKKVASCSTTQYNYNSIKFRKSKFHYENRVFDSLGYTIHKSAAKRKKKSNYAEFYYFDKHYQLQRDNIFVRGKLKYQLIFTWDSLGNNIGYIFLKNGKEKSGQICEYNEKKILGVKYFHRKKLTGQSIYRYERDTGKLLEVIQKDRKGRIKYRWDYSCSPLGDLKKGDQKRATRVCTSENRLPNGHMLKVYDYTEHDGLRRYIYEIDSLEKVISILYYQGKYGEKLKYRKIFEYSDSGENYIFEYYDEKTGVPYYRGTSFYNLKGQILHNVENSFGRKGKFKGGRESTYLYEGDLLVRETNVNLRRPKKVMVTEYSYLFQQ